MRNEEKKQKRKGIDKRGLNGIAFLEMDMSRHAKWEKRWEVWLHYCLAVLQLLFGCITV